MQTHDDDIENLLGPARPRQEVRRYKDLGPLHDLLIEACPPDSRGVKSIPILAKKLKMSAWGIFKWIKAGRIPPRQAVRVVDVSGGRVTLDEFSPYIFR